MSWYTKGRKKKVRTPTTPYKPYVYTTPPYVYTPPPPSSGPSVICKPATPLVVCGRNDINGALIERFNPSSAYENQGINMVQHESMESWGSFLAAMSKPPREGSDNNSAANPKSTRWDGDVGFDGACNLARDGWGEGAKGFGMLLDKVQARISKTLQVPEIKYDVTGVEYDIGAFVAGIPECAIVPDSSFAPIRGELRTIIINISVNCGVDADIVLRRGVYTVGLCSALERVGYPCKIVVLQSASSHIASSGNVHNLISVVALEPGQDFDLPKMAAIGHPGVFRRCFFRLIEQLHEFGPAVTTTGYGHAQDPSPETLNTLYGPGTVYVSPQQSLWSDDDTAWSTLVALLKSQGVHIEAE